MSCKTLGRIPGISWVTPAATCIGATRSCRVSTGVSYTRVFMYPQKWSPMVSGQVIEGSRLLRLHVQSICCQRCHWSGDTSRSYGTNTTNSWSHPWYAGNVSKSSTLYRMIQNKRATNLNAKMTSAYKILPHPDKYPWCVLNNIIGSYNSGN